MTFVTEVQDRSLGQEGLQDRVPSPSTVTS